MRILLLLALLFGVVGVAAIVAALRGGRRPATEKLVERQVLVMRCRYCGAITAVDLSACEGCGAGPA